MIARVAAEGRRPHHRADPRPRRLVARAGRGDAGQPRRRPRAGQPGDAELASEHRTRGSSSRAAAVPKGTYSATSRSFGEWICESGSPKPVMTVGMPLSASAGTIGSVPPIRISAGRAPSARSNASRPSCTAFASGGTSPGAAADQSSIWSVGALGRCLAQEALELRHDLLDVLTRREPDRDVRDRLDRQHRLLQVRRAGRDPVHVERRLGERPTVEVLRGPRRPSGAHPARRARSRRAAAASSRRARRRSARRCPCAAARRACRRARSAQSSARIIACAAFSAAPPNVPECRSRSPVRSVTWK